MTDAAIQALGLVLSWPWILYPVAGTLFAMLFSATPGLNNASLMALVIPLTFAWEPLPVVLLFGALVGGATFMGSVTAILFNIPGKASNAVTLLDGYPLTRQGKAKTAVSCAAMSSALGSSFGIAVLIALLPIARNAALSLGPPEYLVLAIWGLTLIASLSSGSLVRGLIMAGIGLQLSFVGHDPRTAEARFTFGIDYLQDGLSLVPVLLGIFALAEMLDLLTTGQQTISGRRDSEELGGSVMDGIRATFRNFGLLVRSSVIGVIVGAIPGIGGSVAGFVAYGHASHTARDRSRFGHGDIRGLVAPEAASDAKDGGALLPTLALGIPGGTGTAMLLGVLSLHGLAPGRQLLTDHLTLVFALIWSLFLSNWLTSLLGLAMVSPISRLSTLRTGRLVPAILVLAIVGATLYRGLLSDAVCAMIFGVIGLVMKRRGWPRVPLVIALVLGPMLETNLHLTLRLQELGRIDFWSRPLVLGMLALIVLNLVLPIVTDRVRSLRAFRRSTR